MSIQATRQRVIIGTEQAPPHSRPFNIFKNPNNPKSNREIAETVLKAAETEFLNRPGDANERAAIYLHEMVDDNGSEAVKRKNIIGEQILTYV